MSTEKPAGFHEHHRQKRRSGDERPVNKLFVSPHLHDWIEKHPEKAMELGWTVSQYEDPADVVVVIPDPKEFQPKREKKPRAPEKPRNRRVLSFAVPQDEQEDGAGLWDDYIKAGKELAAKAGIEWSDTVRDYTVAMFFFGKGLLAFRDEIDGGEG